MQRLFVREIISIGAVEEGDNSPYSSILFWKRRPRVKGAPDDRGRRGALPPCSSVDRDLRPNRNPEANATEDPWKIIEEIKAMRAERQNMKKHETGEDLAKEIADVVHTRAAAMATHPDFWEKTDVELRAGVWRKHRDLRDLCTAASRSDSQEIVKSGEFADAFKTFRMWRDNPSAGLR